MAAPRTSYRLTLSRLNLKQAPHRWLVGAKHGLGVSQEEAKILWEGLPVTLLTAPLSEAQIERIKSTLSDDQHVVEIEMLTQRKKPCDKHSIIASSSLCQKCRQSACGVCTATHAKSFCHRCASSQLRTKIFRNFRILILLLIAAIALATTYGPQWRLQQWNEPIYVNIHPINAEQSDNISAYISRLEKNHFQAIIEFMNAERRSYDIDLDPIIKLSLGTPIEQIPPAAPVEKPTVLNVIKWSLHIRYWAFFTLRERNTLPADIDIFVLYYDPKNQTVLSHSVGLQKGAIAIVHAFASDQALESNNVIITHEMLHTLGATDKYDAEGIPTFPDGFAHPGRVPLYPQSQAELMGGRIPIGQDRARIPIGLSQCIIGPKTAQEIGWSK